MKEMVEGKRKPERQTARDKKKQGISKKKKRDG